MENFFSISDGATSTQISMSLSVSFYKPFPDLWASRFSWQCIFRLWSSRMWCYGVQ